MSLLKLPWGRWFVPGQVLLQLEATWPVFWLVVVWLEHIASNRFLYATDGYGFGIKILFNQNRMTN